MRTERILKNGFRVVGDPAITTTHTVQKFVFRGGKLAREDWKILSLRSLTDEEHNYETMRREFAEARK